jgi:lipopolysaccharide export system protein LptA
LRNQEAARYARWAAIAAGLIVLVVGGVYLQGKLREARGRREGPKAVPASVQQRSADFSYSDVEQGHTIFKIRASHFTEYKDENRAVLQDVWITVYGRDGSRNDNIHTRECSYAPETGSVSCQGQVQIDIQAAPAATANEKPPAAPLELTTSNLSFNRETGEASTPAEVIFHFAGGQGRGTGAQYSTSDATVRVEHDVEFQLTPSDETDGLPVTATGASLDIYRDKHSVVLNGPATVKQGDRELLADKISIGLDQQNRARTAVAQGHPELHAHDQGVTINASADEFSASLNPAGWLERVAAEGDVHGTRESRAGTDRFAASHVVFTMAPGHNVVNEMTANGSVTAESRQDGDVQELYTEALRVSFSSASEHASSRAGADKGKTSSAHHFARQRVDFAETLAPATIETKNGDDFTTLKAKKFVADVNAEGRVEKLLGHSGVEISRQIGKAPPQTISAAELVATLGADGGWSTIDEQGDVRFRQGDRQATAQRANVVRATDTISLSGSPIISDSQSRTTAGSITVNQQTGAVRATDGVISTYLSSAMAPQASGSASTVSGGTASSSGHSTISGGPNLGAGAAHIAADNVTGSTTSGHVTYEGHARLWQGDTLLEADKMDLWRDDKKLQATGHVVAVFPQVSGPLANPFGQLTLLSAKSAPAASPATKIQPNTPTAAMAPTLWKVHAPQLTYWNDQGKAHLEGGVLASSDQGSLESRTLDIYLAPAAPTPATSSSANSVANSATPPGPTGQLSHVVALGNVIVRQGDRRGMAEQAEYTAADGKFVLSGGKPTITVDSSNTATGRSLTFFVASDTILIDSHEGSRTLTKHRVEK